MLSLFVSFDWHYIGRSGYGLDCLHDRSNFVFHSCDVHVRGGIEDLPRIVILGQDFVFEMEFYGEEVQCVGDCGIFGFDGIGQFETD
jgi:hypothetical protein